MSGERLVILTIAGTDPSGGAGIQADLRAFKALGVYGASVITAALAQNSTGVKAVHPLPPHFIALQIDAVAKDMPIAATKIGMLANERIVSVVADRIARRNLPNVVLDPVLAAKDGRPLLTQRGIKRMLSELLPKALVITPNVPEAAALTLKPVETWDEARDAARILHDLGAPNVIIKGGHWADDAPPTDLVFDGETFTELRGERIAGVPVRGTGCLFSSALAVQIAMEASVPEAAMRAKAFVRQAIVEAVRLGGGFRVW